MSSTCCLKCSQPYRDPRLLSCCHSFCVQCIQSLITEGQRINSLTCPLCHQTTPVPSGDVTSLPCNPRLINKQDDIVGKITLNPPPPCDSCSEDSAVAYCTECTDFLCKKCWDAHIRTRLTRTHSILGFVEMKSMSQEKLVKTLSSSFITCHYHTDQQLKYYCQHCAIPVCIECTIINHKDHPVTEVCKEVSMSKRVVGWRIKRVQEAQLQLKSALTLGEEIKEKIKVSKKEADKVIRQTFASLHQLLHQREKVLLTESNKVANAKEVHLSHQLAEMQSLLEAITQCQCFATTAIAEYNDIEYLSVAHTLQTRANQLQEQFSGISLEPCESPLISIEMNKDELGTKISNFGVVFDGASPTNTIAEIPSHIEEGREFQVRVISRDSKGRTLSIGGASVSSKLTPVDRIPVDRMPAGRMHTGASFQANVLPKVRDHGNGIYLVSMIPQTFGKHQLSLTIHNQSIQGSPFNFYVSRDYTAIKSSPVRVQNTITGITKPYFAAFSNNGDMFVTSYSNNCIHVYDTNKRQRITIGSYGSGQLQFNSPSGIAIDGDVMYVAEYEGNRIHKLTIKGKFLCTFGCRGSGQGQFRNPSGLCIGPDGRIYVADYWNNRIQVLSTNGETFSHHSVIGDGLKGPGSLSFDQSGNLHVTSYTSNTVTVYTSQGQRIRQYGQSHLNGPFGIAIDKVGNSIVANYSGCSFTVFDPRGNYIHSIKGFKYPVGVAMSPDGLVWIADCYNDKLVKY